MSQGLFSAASGIQANQTRLNVISNNIANVNTIGFKSSDVNFATVFSQTVTGGTTPSGELGGTNPMQIGNGVVANEIPTNHGQGGTQFTGRPTDLLVSGEGLLVVERIDQNSGSSTPSYYFTRAGNFSLDAQGNLVTVSGNRVRGTSQISGSVPATDNLVSIPQQLMIVKDLDATSSNILAIHYATPGTAAAAIAGAAVAGTASQNTATVSLVSFAIGTGGNVTATYSNGDRISVRTNPDPAVTTPSLERRQIVHFPSEGGTGAAIYQQAGEIPVTQINGVFTAQGGGVALEGGQLQLQMVRVVNKNGLLYDGSNNFLSGPNSGTEYFGVPGLDGRGAVQAGALESSNVDIAREFSNMIISQRGVEANSRVIRTQSEVIQSIINAV